ncbi:MAG TPA: hypothetical protein VMU95_36240 [Trebonia sp.]|nr:hypothetical protein [Trebonia sp.]
MNTFEWVATIIGIFFVIGVGVGFLIVMALPGIANLLASRVYGEQPPPVNSKDKLDIGPPGSGPDHQEPDDRDSPPDHPWWEGSDS